jgi:hypothetical protein
LCAFINIPLGCQSSAGARQYSGDAIYMPGMVPQEIHTKREEL